MDLPTDSQDLDEIEELKLAALASLRPLDATSTVLGQYSSYNLEVGVNDVYMRLLEGRGKWQEEGAFSISFVVVGRWYVCRCESNSEITKSYVILIRINGQNRLQQPPFRQPHCNPPPASPSSASHQGHSRVIVFNVILFLLIRRFLASASYFAHSDFRSYCLAF